MALLTYPKFQVPNLSGTNLSGGKVYFYIVGTSTPKDTYSDAAFTVPNDNPVILDSRGEADIYVDGAYKIILKDADDVEIWTFADYEYGAESIEDPFAFTGAIQSGYVVANKAEAAALTLVSTDAGRKVFITSSDGGNFTVRYNATPGTYADDGASYCGTQFIPTGGDGTIGLIRSDILYINPVWFGAKGDGVTDDVASIQKAITESTGKTIAFPDGTFLISSALIISSYIRIVGAGSLQTTIKTSSLTADIFDVNVASGVTGIAIENLFLDASTAKTAGWAINVRSAAGTGTINKSIFRDITGSNKLFGGISIGICQTLLLSNITFIKIGQNAAGFFLRGSSDTYNVSNVFMYKCHIQEGTVGSGTTGLLIDSYSEGIYVLQCAFESRGLNRGILIKDGLSSTNLSPKNILMSQVICDAATTNGMQIDEVKGIYITNSWFVSSLNGPGVALIGGDDIHIDSSAIITNGTHGVQINAASTAVRLTGNIIDGNGSLASNTYDGVWVGANAVDFMVCNNVFFRDGSTAWQKYSVNVNTGTSDRYLITNNNLYGYVTKAVNDGGSGTDKYINNNISYVTQNSGTATILSATTSITVTHGLDITPTIDDISIVMGENPTNDPGNVWVDTITSTQFNINCRNDPGASNLDFGWNASVT
jgi:hypothetical protein